MTLTRNKDDAVIVKGVGIADAKIKNDHIHWYVRHYTPSIQQQGILSNQFLCKIPTELRYFERSVFMKEVNIQILWKFKLGSHWNMIVRIWTIGGFQQGDGQDTETRIMILFEDYQLLVLNALLERKTNLMLVY